MNFEEPEMDFREVDRRYAELKRRFDTGSISAEEFDGQRLRLVVRDDQGSWWVKGRTAGGRSYRIESGWFRRTAQGYRSPLAEGTAEYCSQLEQTGSFSSGSQVRDEHSPFSRPKQDEQVAPKADSAAPVLESEVCEALRETKRLGER